jgi:hypothetical protein
MPEIREVSEEGSADYPVITGSYDTGVTVGIAPDRARHSALRADTGVPQARCLDRRGGARAAAVCRVVSGQQPRDAARPPLPEPLPSPVADSHCHLDIAGHAGVEASVEYALEAAASVGVTRIVQVGCDIDGIRWAVQAAEQHEQVIAAVAMHPNDAPRLAEQGMLDDALAEVDSLAAASARSVRSARRDSTTSAPDRKDERCRRVLPSAHRHGEDT